MRLPMNCMFFMPHTGVVVVVAMFVVAAVTIALLADGGAA